jgi:hypothetical protein
VPVLEGPIQWTSGADNFRHRPPISRGESA